MQVSFCNRSAPYSRVQALRADHLSSLSLDDDPAEISGIRKCSGHAFLPSQPLYKLQH